LKSRFEGEVTVRSPERVGRILGLLEKYWSRYPDLRLGQIVGNFTPRLSSGEPGSIYNVEDDILEQAVLEGLILSTPRLPAGEKFNGQITSIPQVGGVVWVVPATDRCGGWGIISQATIGISNEGPTVWIELEGISTTFNWKYLEPIQDRLKLAYPHPAKRDR
jgi:hypothetical protein